MLPLPIELLGARRGAQRREPRRRQAHRARALQAHRVHPPVDRVDAADHPIEHLGCRVVRDDDHQRDEVLHRERGAGIEPLDDARAGLRVRLRERVLVGQPELPGLHLLEGFHHQRNLDGAHRLHLTVGVERDLFARLERLDVDSPRGVDALRRPLDRSLQTLKWSLLLGLESGGQEQRDETSHAVTPTFSRMFASTCCARATGRLLI